MGGPDAGSRRLAAKCGSRVERAPPERALREQDAGGVDGRGGGGHDSIGLDGCINARVPHRQPDQGGPAQRQVPAAELVGLDPRLAGLEVNQPAVVVDGQAQLQWQLGLGGLGRGLERGQDRREERADVGDVVHRRRAFPDVAVDDLARALADDLQDRVVGRRVDDHLGIGPLERLGPDPAEQGLEGLRRVGVGGDLQDAVVLHEGVPAHDVALAGDPDDVGIAAADDPAPVVLGADHRARGAGEGPVVESHQVVELDLPPGPDVPGPALGLGEDLTARREVAAQDRGERVPAADAPAQRPVELRHRGRQRLHDGSGLQRPTVGQPHQVLGEAQTPILRQRADPHHAVHRQGLGGEADLPLGQVHVAGDSPLDPRHQPLVGPVTRVAERPQERLAIRSVEDVQEHLIDRLVVGLAPQRVLHGATLQGEPIGRRWRFHQA